MKTTNSLRQIIASAAIVAFIGLLGLSESQAQSETVALANQLNDPLVHNEALALTEDKSGTETASAASTSLGALTSFPYLSTEQFANVEDYVRGHIRYPEAERIRGKKGHAKVQFDIMPDGSLENIDVVEADSEAFAEEARRLIAGMPQWVAATRAHQPVKTRHQLNLNFRLR